MGWGMASRPACTPWKSHPVGRTGPRNNPNFQAECRILGLAARRIAPVKGEFPMASADRRTGIPQNQWRNPKRLRAAPTTRNPPVPANATPERLAPPRRPTRHPQWTKKEVARRRQTRRLTLATLRQISYASHPKRSEHPRQGPHAETPLPHPRKPPAATPTSRPRNPRVEQTRKPRTGCRQVKKTRKTRNAHPMTVPAPRRPTTPSTPPTAPPLWTPTPLLRHPRPHRFQEALSSCRWANRRTSTRTAHPRFSTRQPGSRRPTRHWPPKKTSTNPAAKGWTASRPAVTQGRQTTNPKPTPPPAKTRGPALPKACRNLRPAQKTRPG